MTLGTGDVPTRTREEWLGAMLVPRRMLGQRDAPVGVALPAEKRSDRVTIVGQGNDFTNSLNVDELN